MERTDVQPSAIGDQMSSGGELRYLLGELNRKRHTIGPCLALRNAAGLRMSGEVGITETAYVIKGLPTVEFVRCRCILSLMPAVRVRST